MKEYKFIQLSKMILLVFLRSAYEQFEYSLNRLQTWDRTLTSITSDLFKTSTREAARMGRVNFPWFFSWRDLLQVRFCSVAKSVRFPLSVVCQHLNLAAPRRECPVPGFVTLLHQHSTVRKHIHTSRLPYLCNALPPHTAETSIIDFYYLF